MNLKPTKAQITIYFNNDTVPLKDDIRGYCFEEGFLITQIEGTYDLIFINLNIVEKIDIISKAK